MSGLRPFWRYYGGKWRAALRYPKPQRWSIVEPFAGAAGYSLRYPDCRVLLVEKYPVIAEVWRYLIGASATEIRRIPCVDHVDDLPGWVPQGGRWLVGFCMNNGASSPRKTLSSGLRKMREAGRKAYGWGEAHRELVASQADHIRHWQVIEGDYTKAENHDATWFIDPPYQNAGIHYVHSSGSINFDALSSWCLSRWGQVIVCENEGADWLPFQRLGGSAGGGINGGGRRPSEVVWKRDIPACQEAA